MGVKYSGLNTQEIPLPRASGSRIAHRRDGHVEPPGSIHDSHLQYIYAQFTQQAISDQRIEISKPVFCASQHCKKFSLLKAQNTGSEFQFFDTKHRELHGVSVSSLIRRNHEPSTMWLAHDRSDARLWGIGSHNVIMSFRRTLSLARMDAEASHTYNRDSERSPEPQRSLRRAPRLLRSSDVWT